MQCMNKRKSQHVAVVTAETTHSDQDVHPISIATWRGNKEEDTERGDREREREARV